MSVPCLECEAVVETPADIKVSEIVECNDCSVELEIISTDPVTVALAPEVEEDWGE
ncbi:lysine biosynthesis protein LysW [Streptomyces sp. NPDC014894]|uniref:lysine biosynthesis protein LysW n=1 Tax=unclassified Streptomyces TaxID=2593676 RepID=UPI0036F6C4F9